MKSENSKWRQLYLNVVLDSEDGKFAISYNPDTNRSPMSTFLKGVLGITGGEETALCLDGKYYILIGDHRAQYEIRIHDLQECIKYFEENIGVCLAPTSDLLDGSNAYKFDDIEDEVEIEVQIN